MILNYWHKAVWYLAVSSLNSSSLFFNLCAVDTFFLLELLSACPIQSYPNHAWPWQSAYSVCWLIPCVGACMYNNQFPFILPVLGFPWSHWVVSEAPLDMGSTGTAPLSVAGPLQITLRLLIRASLTEEKSNTSPKGHPLKCSCIAAHQLLHWAGWVACRWETRVPIYHKGMVNPCLK